MTRELLRDFCLQLPGCTEDIKWKVDLCFCVGEKMFSVQGLAEPYGVSFKTTPEEFEHLISRSGIEPAPYVARYHWVLVTDMDSLSDKEWQEYIQSSYDMVFSKLSHKKRDEITEG